MASGSLAAKISAISAGEEAAMMSSLKACSARMARRWAPSRRSRIHHPPASKASPQPRLIAEG